jgi:hypothetical protein
MCLDIVEVMEIVKSTKFFSHLCITVWLSACAIWYSFICFSQVIRKVSYFVVELQFYTHLLGEDTYALYLL